MAVAGTHGKTTTSSMLAWILSSAGLKPGYLIGGVARNFASSADLGDSPFFVVEADEYDSAFFDKRSKFVHYSPRTAIFNNLEFDHGDIFPDLAAIQRQFHHLVRIIPGSGLILWPRDDDNLNAVLAQGCWSQRQALDLLEGGEPGQGHADEALSWFVRPLNADGSEFELGKSTAGVPGPATRVHWSLSGTHNVRNALAAVAAAHHAGVDIGAACEALESFEGVKRRQELLGEVNGVRVYDDFAHHPTAIDTTLSGLRARFLSAGRTGRLIAVIEPRSNTMKMGVHQSVLGEACRHADLTLWFDAGTALLDLPALVASSPMPARIASSIDALVTMLVDEAQTGDDIVIMSNGGFGGIHQKLLQALAQRQCA
jgi:UDP-N-acetylmuramate: L-alanyl-gamma-D-glutamyl-meso-diaminopimelate ligase